MHLQCDAYQLDHERTVPLSCVYHYYFRQPPHQPCCDGLCYGSVVYQYCCFLPMPYAQCWLSGDALVFLCLLGPAHVALCFMPARALLKAQALSSARARHHGIVRGVGQGFERAQWVAALCVLATFPPGVGCAAQ